MSVLLGRLGDLVLVAFAALIPLLGVLSSPPVSSDLALIVGGMKRQAEATDWDAAIDEARAHVGSAIAHAGEPATNSERPSE